MPSVDPNIKNITARTKASEATSGCKRGTAFQSMGEDTLGRRLQCRTCSTNARTCRTNDLPCGATSHRAGSGCADPMVLGLAQYLGLELLWACPVQESSLLLNRRFCGKAGSVLSDHAHFLAAQTCILDRHA